MPDNRIIKNGVVGPVNAAEVPRFAGDATFARLPRIDQVEKADVAVVGIPFDSGVSYRPGARFGPAAVRQASRLLRPHDPAFDTEPFLEQQVADAGDIACTPFDITAAVDQIERAATILSGEGATRLVTLGGDHTIALPLLRVAHRIHGPIALIHFDAHLDTWDTYFDAEYTHGTPFRRAFEEGLLAENRSCHVGTRGPLYGREDLLEDSDMGFRHFTSNQVDLDGVAGIMAEVRERVGDLPVYVSVDIDVLDPAHAPGTGTPEAGGLSSRELLHMLRELIPTNVVGADVVEVAPAYDQAETTAVAASHVAYSMLSLFAHEKRRSR